MRTRRLWTGVTAIVTSSPARPVPPPRVWTVNSRRETSSTASRIPYLPTLTAPSPLRPIGARPARGRRSGGDRHFLEKLQLVQNLAGAQRHAGQRIVADRDRQIRLLSQQQIEAAQQRSAAGEHDPLVHDVGGQLGR